MGCPAPLNSGTACSRPSFSVESLVLEIRSYFRFSPLVLVLTMTGPGAHDIGQCVPLILIPF